MLEFDQDVVRFDVSTAVLSVGSFWTQSLTDQQQQQQKKKKKKKKKESLTCVDDTVRVSKTQGHHELGGKPAHDQIRDLVLLEPGAKRAQVLPHELKNKKDMLAVWPLVLKVVDEVADVSVPRLAPVSVAEMPEYLPLEDRLPVVIALAAQDLEGEEFVLIVVSGGAGFTRGQLAGAVRLKPV